MSACARCRQPLHEEGRFNITFGGLAHLECPGRAVWPPLSGAQKWEYNPLIALRKMATRDAFAGDEAQVHLRALMAIVSRDFHMQRPLAHEDHRHAIQQPTSPSTTSSSSATSSSSSSSATPSRTPTEPRNVIMPTPTQTPGKRRERPDPSPTATPSPKPKSVRQSEQDVTAQASQQQPATTSNIQPATTSNIQPATNNQEDSEEETDETESKQQPTTSNNQESKPDWMRQVTLSQEVRALGGKLVAEDVDNKYKQTRLPSPEHGDEVLQFSFGYEKHRCSMLLMKWNEDKETKCRECARRTRRNKMGSDAVKEWRCLDHGYNVCVRCIPVVLTTKKFMEFHGVDLCFADKGTNL
jgi:hypothetical protein